MSRSVAAPASSAPAGSAEPVAASPANRPAAALRAEAAAWSRPWLRVALVALVLSAFTGVLLRFGLIQGMPAWAANYGAVRHAHSHLMYFGWGTLGIMALMWALLPAQTGRPLPRGVGLQMGVTSLLSLLSFPAFWSNGYGLTEVLGRALPLGSIAAAVNALPWFLFVGLYVAATRRLPLRSFAVQLWDWALLLLMLATLGAITLGIQIAIDLESSALREASLHLFLDLFATGWFTLATLGLLWAWLGNPDGSTPAMAGEGRADVQSAVHAPWLPTLALALPLTVTFVLGMSPAAVSEPVFWVAALANLAAAVFFALHVRALWTHAERMPALARAGLLFFVLHLLTAIAVLVPGVWRVAVGGQLRVFYLHNLLLGFMSCVLLGLALAVFRASPDAQPSALERVTAGLWLAGVVLMVGALLGLGLARWTPISALFWLQLAAWSSYLPAAASAVALLMAARRVQSG